MKYNDVGLALIFYIQNYYILLIFYLVHFPFACVSKIWGVGEKIFFFPIISDFNHTVKSIPQMLSESLILYMINPLDSIKSNKAPYSAIISFVYL